ncbi:MAG: tetratricopeptide repeat protein [archaeon]|nr:tetratricopeptide repeat protein [archaeon]
MEVIFTAETFRDMILFSGRFSNPSIPETNWKEVYGFLVGKIIERDNEKFLLIKKLIPMIHGTRTEVYFSEDDYIISETILEAIHKAQMFVCGWYHTHPGLGLFLSDTDMFNQLGFQSVFLDAVAVVFDFTKISENNNGFKIYRLDDVTQGIASSFSEVSYQIERNIQFDKFFMARSLVDISGDYKADNLLIKEAGEILKDSGSLQGLLKDLYHDDAEKIKSNVSSDQSSGIELSEMGDFNQQINEFEKYYVPSEESEDHFGSTFDDSGYYEILEQYSDNDWEIRSLRERIEKLKELGKPTGYLLIKLANRLMEITKFNESLGYLEAAEAEFLNSSDGSQEEKDIGISVIKNELGLFHEERGDYNTALNYFESCSEILEKMGNNIKITQVYNNIGNIYLKMENYDSAFSHYKKAFLKSQEMNYHLGMIASLNNAVEVLLFLHNYRLAYDVLMSNFNFFKATNNIFGIGITYSKLGHLYFTQGEKYYKISENYFRMALQVKILNQYPKDTLEDWIFLSQIFSSRSEMDLAENCLLQGLNIVRTYELSKEEGRFYDLLADIYLITDRIDEMMEYYKFALENYQDFGNDEKSSKVSEKMAELSVNLFNNPQKALDYLYNSLEIYRNQHYSKMIGETLLKISDIHIDIQDESSAIECLIEAKSIFNNLYDEFTVQIITEKLRSIRNE